MRKIIYFIIGVLVTVISVFPIAIGSGGQLHSTVTLDPASMQAYEISFSYSHLLRNVFGDVYTLVVNFKTASGTAIDVYLINPQYLHEFEELNDTVHYYKHVHAAYGKLELNVPIDMTIAIVIANTGIISTSVDLSVHTNVGDTLYYGGILSFILGAALAGFAFFTRKNKEEVKSITMAPAPPPEEIQTITEEPTPPPVEEQPKPRVYKPIPVTSRARPRIPRPDEVIKKIRVLDYAFKNGLITEEEYMEKKRELIALL